MAIERLTSYTPPATSATTTAAGSATAAASTSTRTGSGASGSTAEAAAVAPTTTLASGEQVPTPRFPWLSFLSSRLAAEAAIETHQFESPVLGDNVNHFA